MDMQKYRVACTLTFGDIYGQIMVWLIVIFLSLASALGLMGASRPVYALATVGIILVLSLPSFVTTFLNHIEFTSIDPATQVAPSVPVTTQKPAQAAG
jgi:hypothetical protein